MSGEAGAAPRIWTRRGFVADRFSEASGAAFFSPGEATGRIGAGTANVLMLEPGDEPVADRLDEIDAVFIAFPVFSDGRGFSTARLLRDRYRFAGTIRATGHFILDQIPLMLRTGFDEFAVTHAPTQARLEKGDTGEIPLYFQPAAVGEHPAGGRAWARRKSCHSASG